jgi:hypothetical protein
MSKKTPPLPDHKVPMNFRIWSEDRRRLMLGAKKMGVAAVVYLQFALRAKFKEDGIE